MATRFLRIRKMYNVTHTRMHTLSPIIRYTREYSVKAIIYYSKSLFFFLNLGPLYAFSNHPVNCWRLFNVCHMGICKFITTNAAAVRSHPLRPATGEWWWPAAKMCFSVCRSGVWIELNHRPRKIVGTILGHSRPSLRIRLNRGQHTNRRPTVTVANVRLAVVREAKTKSPFINLNYYAVADRYYNKKRYRTAVEIVDDVCTFYNTVFALTNIIIVVKIWTFSCRILECWSIED